MKNGFVFNGKDSRHFGIYVSGEGTFNAPQRDISTVEIKGRSGSLTIDNKCFKNIMGNYPAFVRMDFRRNVEAVREWLLKDVGYKRLEDSYHPQFYRMARFIGPLDFDMRFLNLSGECTISFDCMPQRFLKSGEIKEIILRKVKIGNPTEFASKPLFRVYGSSGRLLVNNTIMHIGEIDDYVDIDCDLQDAYKETQNKNGTISQDFPVLEPGKNTIDFEGNITKIEMIPRWWTI